MVDRVKTDCCVTWFYLHSYVMADSLDGDASAFDSFESGLLCQERYTSYCFTTDVYIDGRPIGRSWCCKHGLRY